MESGKRKCLICNQEMNQLPKTAAERYRWFCEHCKQLYKQDFFGNLVEDTITHCKLCGEKLGIFGFKMEVGKHLICVPCFKECYDAARRKGRQLGREKAEETI